VQEWSEATTVSIGVASLTPVVTVEWSALVTAADKALYAAKASGRNSCVVATVPQLSLVA
jgi:PleD family two-component response regulator